MGCEAVDQLLLFRDWLRSHPVDRELYERTTRALASREWQYTQNYADAMSTVVREIIVRARKAPTGIFGFLVGKRFGVVSGGWGDNAGLLFAMLFMAVGALLYRNYFATF